MVLAAEWGTTPDRAREVITSGVLTLGEVQDALAWAGRGTMEGTDAFLFREQHQERERRKKELERLNGLLQAAKGDAAAQAKIIKAIKELGDGARPEA